MGRMNRRDFVKTSAAVGLSMARSALAGPRGQRRHPSRRRGDSQPGPQSHQLVPQDPRRARRRDLRRGQELPGPGGKRVRRAEREGGHVRGLPQAARGQEHRRRDHRDAEPLARAGHRLGLPGGQGRLRREARLPQHLGGPADGRGGPQVQSHRPERHAAALGPGASRGPRIHQPGQPRQGAPGPGLRLRAPRQHRQGRRARSRCPSRWTTISGAVRPRWPR